MPDPLPRIKQPMAATQVARPFHRDGWVWEEKYDGWRVIAYKDGSAVRLVSRSGKDLTKRYPGLVAAFHSLPAHTLILDGEVCRFDDQLVSRFEWMHRSEKDETATPPILMTFDCLYMRGKDLRDRPLRVRWNVLEAEVDGHRLILPARRLTANGLQAWAEVLERGYEGYVGKDEESPYREGRTLAWLKVKQPRYHEGERG